MNTMKKEEKQIKEQRFTRDEVSNIKFEDRTLEFWDDIDGIIALLNSTDPKKTNTNIESPQVTHYLLWRILNELKGVGVKQKKISDIMMKKEESYKRNPNTYR